MKKIILLFVIALASFSCSTENENQDAAAKNALINPNIVNSGPTSNWGDYNVAVTVSADGTEWTYTITRTKPTAKDLSHFIIDLNNCGENSATFDNILWATVNGSPAVLADSEGSGTGCNPQATTHNFVKFDDLEEATSWVLVLKFDTGYEIFENGAGWIKAGTSCNQGVILAPGCPRQVCSFSQGYFFANGAVNNGSSLLWADGLTIGGVSYTQAQGNQAWNIDRGPGGDQTMNAFFQLGAVRLSSAESQVALDAELVDAYFTGINIFSTVVTSGGNHSYSYFNFPATSNGVTKTQLFAAGARIGNFVKENHCE